MTRSSEIFARASRVLPGGVNSPVRAFRAVGGTPLVLRSGAGCRVEDEDGNSYLDFVGSWGPLILGHAHPEVRAAVHEAVDRGMTFGAPCRGEVLLAEAVVDAYPGIEQLRCVSSGTEAVMSAIRLARGFTGRDIIVKFSGCYHGHADHLLVAAGSGLATFGKPSSAGVPEAIQSGATEIYRGLFQGLLRRGVNIAPSAYEVGFLSTAHRADDIEAFAVAVEGALTERH